MLFGQICLVISVCISTVAVFTIGLVAAAAWAYVVFSVIFSSMHLSNGVSSFNS